MKALKKKQGEVEGIAFSACCDETEIIIIAPDLKSLRNVWRKLFPTHGDTLDKRLLQKVKLTPA